MKKLHSSFIGWLAFGRFTSVGSRELLRGRHRPVDAFGGRAIDELPTASEVSLYKPENGPAVNVFFGRYLGNCVSVQANYIWNSNDLTFVASRVLTQDASFYSETRGSSETSVVGDVVFFRDRHSLVRPYLSCGIGVVHVGSSQQKLDVVSGSIILPPRDFSAHAAGLRVAVGIDVKDPLRLFVPVQFQRNHFLKSHQRSVVSPGTETAEKFPNLWGFVKNF